MRIAYLVHDYHRGGGQSRYVAELATRFAKDHEVHVFANRIEADPASGIHFHHVPAWRASALTTVLSFPLPAALKLGRGFDIVHSQGFCAFRGNVFTGHICNRAWHVALENLEGGASLRESVFDTVASALEYWTYRFMRRGPVIAISKRVAADLERFYHCSVPARVIYHGVDAELFSPEQRLRWRRDLRAQHGLSQEEVVYLYVGDLRKGAARCIQALRQLPEGKLVLVSRSSLDPYRRIAERAQTSDRVLFLGPSKEIQTVYALADALLLPTPYDAFAMVVSEAMASGLPVVVSRMAGASELVQHGVNGLLLDEVTSVGELVQCMHALAADRLWAAELGRQARKTVEAMTWDSVAEQTMQVYEEVLRRAN